MAQGNLKPSQKPKLAPRKILVSALRANNYEQEKGFWFAVTSQYILQALATTLVQLNLFRAIGSTCAHLIAYDQDTVTHVTFSFQQKQASNPTY